MVTILDELTYAEELLKGSPKMFVSGIDIRVLSKYFYSLNYDQETIYSKIVEYYKEREPDFNEFIHQNRILKIINSARNSNLRLPIDVPITKNEFEKIRTLKSHKIEKLLFTMLVLAKYFKLSNPNFIEDEEKESVNKDVVKIYFLTMDKGKILSFAKINKKRDENLFNILFKSKMIEHYNSQKGHRFKVLFDQNDNSEIKIIVKDMNKIYDYYKPYCEVCGIEIEKKSNRHSMCGDCWKEREREIKRNWWKKSKLDV